MPSVLLLFAHPALEKSRINRRLLRAVGDLPGVTSHDLYEEYPDFDVDVSREQTLLEAHDLLVVQHPLFWYSVPPLLKQWIDLVLEHGWAYGAEGQALQGKPVLSVISTGGREDTYGPRGAAGLSIRELLAPIEQTFRLCGMVYLPPFVVHGAHGMAIRRIDDRADEYRRTVEALCDGRLDLETAASLPRFGGALEDVLAASR